MAVAFQDVAVIAAVIIAPQPRAPVPDGKRPNEKRTGHGFHRRLLAPAQLGDPAQPRPAQQVARARRRHDLRPAVEAPQRPPIEVVEMRVRKQNEIDRRQLFHRQRGRGQAFRPDRGERQRNPDPAQEHRIGQDGDAKEIQQDGGVAEPGGAELVVRPLARARFCPGGRDRAPALEGPFPPEMRDPVAPGRRG